jgi:hypothetical protein
MTRAAVAGALAALALLAGCSASGSPPPAPSTVTHTRTQTLTRPPQRPYVPPPAASVKPLPPGHPVHKGEKEGRCPYIRAGLDVDSGNGVNLADLEGDRVYRTTVLTKYKPIGCRFYFYAAPYEAVADIRPITFATATQAYNAMVRTAEAGEQAIPAKNFIDGLTGISFQTRYFGPDGRQDWAFVFAKGKVLVGVYTQRSDTSRNALYVAKAIAKRF